MRKKKNIRAAFQGAFVSGLSIMSIRKLIAILFLVIVMPVLANPSVNFTVPTSVNNTNTSVNKTYINITTNYTIDTVKLEWNGTNFTIDSLSLVFNVLFEENSTAAGGTKDKSRQQNNMTSFGSPYFNDTGMSSHHYSFTGGTTTYFSNDQPTSGLPTGNAPRTMEIWFRTSIPTSGNRAMLAWGAETNNALSMLSVIGNKCYFSSINGDVDGATTVNDGLWHHCAFTYDGDLGRIFKDGVLETTTNILDLNTAATRISIGGNFTVNFQSFNGDLFGAKVWNRNLSAAEINASYMNRASSLARNNISSYYANMTNLANGTYTYRAYVNSTTGTEDFSETRLINIGTVPPAETDNVPVITIVSPLNNTLSNNTPYNITFNWSVTDDKTSSLKCWRYVGTDLIASDNVSNNTQKTETYLLTYGSGWNFTIECQDTFPQNASLTRRFHLAQGLNLTIVNGGNNSALNYTINITNTTSSIVLTGAGFSTFFDQVYYPKGGNNVTIVLNISNYMYTTVTPQYRNTTITINETNITYLNITVWRAQEFRTSGTPSNFTINFTNSTRSQHFSTNNTRLWISLGDLPWNDGGNVNIVVNSFGYNTISETRAINGSSQLNVSYSFITSQLLIFVYNELDNTRIEYANVTLSNDTTTQNYTNVNGTVAINLSVATRGDIIVTVYAQNGNRKYYITLLDNETRILNTFFSTNQMYFYKFNVRSGSVFLDGVLIQHQRFINGTHRTNVECKTQIGGDCTIYLEPAIIHKVLVTKTGYTTISQNREYSAADRDTTGTIIVISMTTSGNATIELLPINAWQDGNITIVWTFNSSLVYEITTINVTISDAQNSWSYVWLNVTRANFTNGTQYFFSNSTGSSSYTLAVRLNSTGLYTYRLCFFRASDLRCVTRVFILQSALQGFGNWSAVEYETQGGLSVYTWKLASIIGVSAIGGTVGAVGGRISALLFMAAGFFIAGQLEIFTFNETIALMFLIVILLFFAFRGDK